MIVATVKCKNIRYDDVVQLMNSTVHYSVSVRIFTSSVLRINYDHGKKKKKIEEMTPEDLPFL